MGIFSSRMDHMTPSATLEYAQRAKRPGIINLTVGRLDLDTPKCIKEATKRSLDEGKVHYTPVRGIPELLSAIANKLTSENKIKEITERNVVIGAGAKELIADTIFVLVDKGDVVAVPDPAWVSYESLIGFAGGQMLRLHLKHENGFAPDEGFLSDLENCDAKLLILNSPNNPTGAVYSEKMLRKIVDICQRKGMWLMSDEVYEKIIYGAKHFSPGSIYDKAITINGFSKQFSMTGWRMGYMACKDMEFIKKLTILQSQVLSCAPCFAQYGAVAGFTKEGRKSTKDLVGEMKKRRKLTLKRLKKYKLGMNDPNGTFYAFPHFGWNDVELSDRLFGAGVGVVPGSPFGPSGSGCIRISYGSADRETLKEAFDRIDRVLL